MTAASQVVFLLDVDNTLLDNDRVIDELLNFNFTASFGPARFIHSEQGTT